MAPRPPLGTLSGGSGGLSGRHLGCILACGSLLAPSGRVGGLWEPSGRRLGGLWGALWGALVPLGFPLARDCVKRILHVSVLKLLNRPSSSGTCEP